jgi:hypothetical protein
MSSMTVTKMNTTAARRVGEITGASVIVGPDPDIPPC